MHSAASAHPAAHASAQPPARPHAQSPAQSPAQPPGPIAASLIVYPDESRYRAWRASAPPRPAQWPANLAALLLLTGLLLFARYAVLHWMPAALAAPVHYGEGADNALLWVFAWVLGAVILLYIAQHPEGMPSGVGKWLLCAGGMALLGGVFFGFEMLIQWHHLRSGSFLVVLPAVMFASALRERLLAGRGATAKNAQPWQQGAA